MPYKAQIQGSTRYTCFNTERAAREEAQEVADSTGNDCDVWERIETVRPQPKPETVSHDIEKVMARVLERGGVISGAVYGLLLDELESGRKTIRLPSGVKL